MPAWLAALRCSWPFQMPSQGFCNFCGNDLMHKWGNKQDASVCSFFFRHTVFACANKSKPSTPSGEACQKQCDILVWFMSHPWLLAFATVVLPLNSAFCAPGPACPHPRLSNTDGTLSNLTAARVQIHQASSGLGPPHANQKKEQKNRAKKGTFQAFPQPIGLRFFQKL